MNNKLFSYQILICSLLHKFKNVFSIQNYLKIIIKIYLIKILTFFPKIFLCKVSMHLNSMTYMSANMVLTSPVGCGVFEVKPVSVVCRWTPEYLAPTPTPVSYSQVWALLYSPPPSGGKSLKCRPMVLDK